MSTDSLLKSQSVNEGHEVEAASQPSSTQGLESAHIDSNPNPDSEPDVILIEEYKKEKEDK